MLGSWAMARQQLHKRSNLPARRRLVSWEGTELNSPPPLHRRPGRRTSKERSPWHPREPRRSFSFLGVVKRLSLLAAAFLIFFGARWLVDFMFKPHSLGIPPDFVNTLPADSGELPRLPLMDSATAARKLKRGDTIASVARTYGLDQKSAAGLNSALQSHFKDRDSKQLIPAGHFVDFHFDRAGQLKSVSLESEPGKKLFLLKQGDQFVTSVINVSSAQNERISVGIIESSFAAAATKAGVRYDIVDDLVDLFSNRVEFKKDFHAGDRFTVITRDVLLSDGRPTGTSQILAAALEVNNEHLVATRYVGSDGKARFFNEKGELLGNSFLRYPLKFSRISSVFTQARFHPILKISKPHNGVDFAAPIGTPVRSVADGVVAMAGANGGSGNMIKIKHGDRYSTAYLHLSSITSGVSKGAHIRRGDVIGAVGMSGLATGPHLHFAFFDYDKYVDPLSIKLPMLDALDGGTKIDGNYLKRVLFTLEHYQTVELKEFYQQ